MALLAMDMLTMALLAMAMLTMDMPTMALLAMDACYGYTYDGYAYHGYTCTQACARLDSSRFASLT